MEHFAIHARRGLWLFHTWEEARALWDRFVAIGPLHHLCLMPDHLHLLAPQVPRARLAGAMSGYARWLGHHWGWPGLTLWGPHGSPALLTNPEHLERTRRYILLNPCRGGLVDDPLGWAFSTHRDAVGMAWPRARRAVRDPHAFHAYVSRDRAVDPEGTELPYRLIRTEGPSFEDVLYALSAVHRTPVPKLLARGANRRTLIHCARALTHHSTRELAEHLGIHHSAVVKTSSHHDRLTETVERTIGDVRFPPLEAGDLRSTPGWLRYRAYLAAKRRRKAAAARGAA